MKGLILMDRSIEEDKNDLFINRKIEKLLILKYVGKTKQRKSCYLTRCDCGTEKILRKGDILSGYIKSCGCLRDELLVNRRKTHGMADKNLEYSSWKAMRTRCTNTKIRSYPDYGGRGITVCKEWDDFNTFYTDMGKKPSPKYSIDRIDVNGNYTKDNCKWSTRAEQNRNQRARKDNALGYRGIHVTKSGMYTVMIKYMHKDIEFGPFKSLKAAIAARQMAEIKYWGEVITKYPLTVYI